MTTSNYPPVPRISIKGIINKRDKLIESAQPFLYKKLVSDTYWDFVDCLHKKLPFPILRNTIHESVKSILKQELTPDLLKEVSWRLAGNVDKLTEQIPAYPWLGQLELEWIPVQITGIQAVKTNGEFKTLLVFQSLGGSVVPLKITQTWSNKKIKYLATYKTPGGNGFGFSKSHFNSKGEQTAKGLFKDARQFYRLCCLMLIGPAKSDRGPEIIEITNTSATTSYNKKIIRGRDRHLTACLKNLPVAHDCHLCPYGIDKCPMATREVSFIKAVCKQCDSLGFVDPSNFDCPDLCLSCARRKML
jgi:hypothetical protein